MTFTIGRAGIDVTLDPPSKVSDTGDKVTFEQPVQTCASLNDVRYLQAQLIGMKNNPDEPFVPVVWTDDPSFTGYYKVASVEVGLIVPSLASFVFPWKVELERVDQFAQPIFELISTGKLRTNGAGIASLIDFYGLPSTAWLADYTGAYPTTWETRALNGSTQTWPWQSSITSGQTSGYFGIPAASFYTGAARLEWSLDSGSTWRAFTGRNMPNVPYAFRLINDLVTVRFQSSSTLDPYLTAYTGAAYGTAKQFSLAETGSLTTTTGTWSSATVMRNSPSGVSVRMTKNYANGSVYMIVDMTLRPGAAYVAFRFASNDGSLTRGVKRSSNEAGTAVTGGIRATSDDAIAGYRYVLSTPAAFTIDTTVGAIRSTGTASFLPFMIGAEINGSAATGNATAANLILQYHAASQQTLRMIGR